MQSRISRIHFLLLAKHIQSRLAPLFISSLFIQNHFSFLVLAQPRCHPMFSFISSIPPGDFKPYRYKSSFLMTPSVLFTRN